MSNFVLRFFFTSSIGMERTVTSLLFARISFSLIFANLIARFLFFVLFLFVRKGSKMFIGTKYHQQYLKNIHIIKFRTCRKVKNMILSINFAILTFFKVLVKFSETF